MISKIPTVWIRRNMINHHFSLRLAACHKARAPHTKDQTTRNGNPMLHPNDPLYIRSCCKLFPRYHGIEILLYIESVSPKDEHVYYFSSMTTEVMLGGVIGFDRSPEPESITGVEASTSSVFKLAASSESIAPNMM